MNFLAHLFLSGGRENLIVGNFLGDFLKNKEVALLPEHVREGIRLHRQIDSFTDAHPMVLQSARRLRPVHGKYSPVILDVFHDFILAKNWQTYSVERLESFAAETYEILKKNIGLMPPFLQERLPRMIADDWLVRYGTEDGLAFTFTRLKTRTSVPALLDNAVASLKKDYPDFEAEFNAFFPDVLAFTKKMCSPATD